MPVVKNQFMRLQVIDDLLCKNKWVKTKQIRDALKEKCFEGVSEKTIQNDIRDMKEDSRYAFWAPIEYSTKEKAYTYTEDGYSIKRFGLRSNEIAAFKFYADCLSMFKDYSLFDDFKSGIEKIINGVELRSRLKDSTNPKRIIQSDSLVTAKGTDYLETLISAIDNQYCTLIKHRRFTSDKTSEREVLPLFIKEYRNRWYLIAQEANTDTIKTFAFDRILSVSVSQRRFTLKQPFDADEHFKHCFGITSSDGPVERIILRFDQSESPWVLSLPIHPSQKVLTETLEYTDIEVTVKVSHELIEYLQSKGSSVKILEPLSLRERIVKAFNSGLRLYS